MENQVKKIGALEVDGDYSLYEKSVGFLALNWEGDVEQVLTKKNFDMTLPSRYSPIDKGGIPLYGFDVHGYVICGLCASTSDINGNTYPEHQLRIVIVEIDHTDSYGWDAAVSYQKAKARQLKEAEEEALRKVEVAKAQKAAAEKLAEQKAKEKACLERKIEKEVKKRLAAAGVAVTAEKRKRGRPRKNPLPKVTA